MADSLNQLIMLKAREKYPQTNAVKLCTTDDCYLGWLVAHLLNSCSNWQSQVLVHWVPFNLVNYCIKKNSSVSKIKSRRQMSPTENNVKSTHRNKILLKSKSLRRTDKLKWDKVYSVIWYDQHSYFITISLSIWIIK